MTDIKITPSPYGTWEYIPAGGMALTAEQVEDVRTMLWSPGVTALEAFRRLRALFPATEPAEDSVGDPLQAWKEFLKPKPIGWYSTMTREFATEHFGFPEVTGLLECTHTASDGGTWGWCGGDWELLVYPPAPAVPAEEETKAEAESDLDMHPDAVYGREYVEQAKVRRIARDVKECDTPTSSPVVPAPTEPVYVNVPTWQEVPEGITYHPEGRPEGFVNRGGQPYYLGMSKPLSATFEQLEDFMRPQGPFYFVPAPTETGPWQTWQEVPEGVKYKSSKSFSSAAWFNQDHNRYASTPDGERHLSSVDDGKMNSHLAPFVAVEEG